MSNQFHVLSRFIREPQVSIEYLAGWNPNVVAERIFRPSPLACSSTDNYSSSCLYCSHKKASVYFIALLRKRILNLCL